METFQNDDKSINSGAKSRPFHRLLLCNYSMLHYKQIAIIILFALISLVIMVVTIVILTSNKSAVPIFPPETSSDPPSTTINPNGLIRIYSRKEWSAMPPKPEIDPNLKLPVEIVIIAHTGDNTNCTTTEKCLRYVRNLQKYSMTKAFKPLNDIAYNFVVAGDGNAYEGRGWFKKGAHSGDINNNRSIGIGFAGLFEDVEPPQQQLRIAQLLIEEGVYLKYISPMYKLYGACQLIDSKSPGKALYNIISKWPHWEELKP